MVQRAKIGTYALKTPNSIRYSDVFQEDMVQNVK